MIKKLYLFLFFVPILTLSQEVVSTSGDYFSNTNGSLAFTIGEIAIETLTSGSNSVTQGFHQTNVSVLSVNEIDTNLVIEVYPNPTSGILQVSMNDFTNKTYKLYDITGRLIIGNPLTKVLSEINLSSYAGGIYILAVYQENNKKIQTYRIIKN